jgi:hypothetical protein
MGNAFVGRIEASRRRKYQMKLNEMTTEERSLLLYIETCSVDYGGLVNYQHINDDDRKILKQWDEGGFISFSRITFDSLQLLKDKNNSNLVHLSEEAWNLAHKERRARSARMSKKSPYRDLITTKTKNASFAEMENTAEATS